jgi:hypothetical protein
MRPKLSTISFGIGIVLIALGYYQLAVPPDALSGVMLARAKNGMLCVLCGGTTIMLWLIKR